ncbi:TIGR01906 family membrane protein [Sporolactobacillus shoreicorticis]|uniref:TIGR01906 family membrane protein n=1 Tax=Sporolactobacillus shoreicorticis TaxID=1923877 RepID=A0ABW5RXS8_9BACL|nr:TIGR01906 family membrane protein [Sporolactobacillus shoreicorticis]MCO7127923.1 TIGR01906 family membrane protein [Sporolactobacillus shoreicorticis]
MPFTNYRFIQWGLAISVAVFIICFAITVTLAFTPLYYFDIRYLNIAEQAGISNAHIVENYNYTILYLLNPFSNVFDLPSLPYSTGGRIHFQDVKRIFTVIEVLFVLSAVISVIGIKKNMNDRNYSFLKPVAIVLTLFTVVPLLMFAIDFNRTFIMFHKLFFRNNYWIFDPDTDPIINILPETFFLHAALLILGIIAICITAIVVIYRKYAADK